ncbi:MAG: hypothetical protein JWP44_2495 [Mucilaginibacter sp.]|nr:hypothetical protein [Mucilaginibacter sp.]
MKLKFSEKHLDDEPKFQNLIIDTLTRTKKQLQIYYSQLSRKIYVDTAFGGGYINQWNNPKFRLRMKKFQMPCFLALPQPQGLLKLLQGSCLVARNQVAPIRVNEK